MTLGFLAALVAGSIAQVRLSAEGTYRAEAVLQLAAEEPAAKRQQRVFLLRSRDLITHVLAEPAVASLPSVKGSADPAGTVADRLAVADPAADLLRVTLTGNDPDEVKTILDTLVKRYVDDATAFDRRALDDQLKKHEQLAESLRLEIEAMEKQIELIGKANSTTGGEDSAKRPAELQRKHIDADSEYTRLGREIGRLEAESTVLKRQAAQKDPVPPADPNRDARIAQLATTIEIKKEERKSIQVERDAYKRLIDNGVGGGLNIDSLRTALQPQKNTLDKLNAQLGELRVHRDMDVRISLRGTVAAAPVRTGTDRATAIGVPAVGAFAVGFALATGFCFVGLVFRVLRRYA